MTTFDAFMRAAKFAEGGEVSSATFHSSEAVNRLSLSIYNHNASSHAIFEFSHIVHFSVAGWPDETLCDD